jgi:type II secretory pathway pseudopilin PulG
MRRLLIATCLFVGATAANAQTSTTNCSSIGSSISCTTNNSAQQQEQMNQAFRNLGAAIAARRERKREEKAAEELRAQQEAVKAAVQRAIESDNAPASPPPSDEEPVLLVCTINNNPASIALYEKHNRADVTSSGVTHTRLATFTAEAVTWTTPLLRNTLSRVDGSYTGYGNIPEVEGQSITGACKLATARAF